MACNSIGPVSVLERLLPVFGLLTGFVDAGRLAGQLGGVT
jgi:hypothetical protein